MKIVLLNLILHTAEKGVIPRHESNHDCMIYNMARGFVANGHDVTVIAAKEYRPIKPETNSFKVIYFSSGIKSIFKPHLLPFPKGLYRYLKHNSDDIDLIISSEVFSIGSLIASFALPSKLMIWHELSAHQKLMKHIPSRIWYNFVAPIFFRNIPVTCRSEQAKVFLKKYLSRVSDDVVDHGANSEIFRPSLHNMPDDKFIVISQLISRKRVDCIIRKFAKFVKIPHYAHYSLEIVGKGTQEKELQQLVEELGIKNNVNFHGFLSHEKLAPLSTKSKALLVFTEQDLNMVSIPESIVNGTPVITNSVPNTATFIAKHNLGIVNDDWGEEELAHLADNYDTYHNNCLAIRSRLTETGCAKKLVEIWKCGFSQ